MQSAARQQDYPARVIERKSHFEQLSDTLRRNLDTYLARSKTAVSEIVATAKLRAEMYQEFSRKTGEDLDVERENLDRIGG